MMMQLLLVRSNEHPYEKIIKAAQDFMCDVIFQASHGRRCMSAGLLQLRRCKSLHRVRSRPKVLRVARCSCFVATCNAAWIINDDIETKKETKRVIMAPLSQRRYVAATIKVFVAKHNVHEECHESAMIK